MVKIIKVEIFMVFFIFWGLEGLDLVNCGAETVVSKPALTPFCFITGQLSFILAVGGSVLLQDHPFRKNVLLHFIACCTTLIFFFLFANA